LVLPTVTESCGVITYVFRAPLHSGRTAISFHPYFHWFPNCWCRRGFRVKRISRSRFFWLSVSQVFLPKHGFRVKPEFRDLTFLLIILYFQVFLANADFGSNQISRSHSTRIFLIFQVSLRTRSSQFRDLVLIIPVPEIVLARRISGQTRISRSRFTDYSLLQMILRRRVRVKPELRDLVSTDYSVFPSVIAENWISGQTRISRSFLCILDFQMSLRRMQFRVKPEFRDLASIVCSRIVLAVVRINPISRSRSTVYSWFPKCPCRRGFQVKPEFRDLVNRVFCSCILSLLCLRISGQIEIVVCGTPVALI
jgi:hypothetical protein